MTGEPRPGAERQQLHAIPELAGLDLQELGETARAHGLDLVVLFGSTAKGKRRAGSDLDVAIRFAGPRQRPPTLEEEAIAESALFEVVRPPCELDMVVLNGASPLLQWNVARNGVPLYCASPATWARFRIRARGAYEDSARFRHRHWQVFLRRLARDDPQR